MNGLIWKADLPGIVGKVFGMIYHVLFFVAFLDLWKILRYYHYVLFRQHYTFAVGKIGTQQLSSPLFLSHCAFCGSTVVDIPFNCLFSHNDDLWFYRIFNCQKIFLLEMNWFLMRFCCMLVLFIVTISYQCYNNDLKTNYNPNTIYDSFLEFNISISNFCLC